MGILYGRAGRLTTKNGGFWPGQIGNGPEYDGDPEKSLVQLEAALRVQIQISNDYIIQSLERAEWGEAAVARITQVLKEIDEAEPDYCKAPEELRPYVRLFLQKPRQVGTKRIAKKMTEDGLDDGAVSHGR
jgi:hypothetical protein